jgi:hypothetical protein
MDYAMPRADDVPSIKVGTKVTPCTHNPLGAKGCGEAGAIGAPSAMMNAGPTDTAARGTVSRDIQMPASAASRCGRRSRRRMHRRHACTALEIKKADSVASAAALLAQTNGKLLAGGQSLVARG